MSGESRGRMFMSLLIGLILTVLPLPSYLDVVRPAFLVMTIIYWSIYAPRVGGVGAGWFSGLLLDVFQGPVLGEHAMALAAVTYVFCREHQRIRSKPTFQQSLIVMAGLGAYELIVFLIDGWTGHAITSPLRWIHIATGAIVWAPVAALLAQGRRS